MGLDWIEGRYGTDKPRNRARSPHGASASTFFCWKGLEMLGVALVLYAFLRHLSSVAAGRDASAHENGSGTIGVEHV